MLQKPQWSFETNILTFIKCLFYILQLTDRLTYESSNENELPIWRKLSKRNSQTLPRLQPPRSLPSHRTNQIRLRVEVNAGDEASVAFVRIGGLESSLLRTRGLLFCRKRKQKRGGGRRWRIWRRRSPPCVFSRALTAEFELTVTLLTPLPPLGIAVRRPTTITRWSV